MFLKVRDRIMTRLCAGRNCMELLRLQPAAGMTKTRCGLLTPQAQLCQACEPGPPDQARTDFIAFATRKWVLDGTPPARNVQQRLSDGWLNADTGPRTPEAACTPPPSHCNTAHPEKSDTHHPPDHADQPRSDRAPTADRSRVKRSHFTAGSPEEAESEPTPKPPRTTPGSNSRPNRPPDD